MTPQLFAFIWFAFTVGVFVGMWLNSGEYERGKAAGLEIARRIWR